MYNLSDEVTRRLLRAARTLFARHGFGRTSLADVAAEAGVARATLYVRFRDKRALVASLADWLVSDALTAATAAWDPASPLADNLAATLLAKDLPFYRLLHASPHGAELLAVDAELTRAQAQRLEESFVALLARWVTRLLAEDEVDLGVFSSPEGFARFFTVAGAGLKEVAKTEEEYQTAVRQLCAVTARATAPAAVPPAG